jgi:hypothetical protein
MVDKPADAVPEQACSPASRLLQWIAADGEFGGPREYRVNEMTPSRASALLQMIGGALRTAQVKQKL